MENKLQAFYTFLFIVIIVLGLFALFSFRVISGTERGVVFKWNGGVQNEVLSPGLHVINPITTSIIKYDVTENKITIVTDASSRDQQLVRTTITLIYNVNPNTVDDLYSEVGTDYANKILYPSLESSTKSATAQFDAEDLIKERDNVTSLIYSKLVDKLNNSYININSINIINFNFSQEYSKAIEDKVIAQQNALKALNDLQTIQIEKNQTIVKAEADKEQNILIAQGNAEAIKIEQEALDNNPEVLQYKWIEKWNGVMPSVVGSNTGVLLNFNNSEVK